MGMHPDFVEKEEEAKNVNITIDAELASLLALGMIGLIFMAMVITCLVLLIG